MRQPLLVVGCGNDLAGDDGVGAVLVNRLMQRRPADCEFRICGRAPLDVLELFETANAILFVDAVVSGAAPGTIHLTPLPSQDVQGRVGGVSTHGFGVVEAIDLARALRRRVPPLFLIGIEADGMTPGAPLSPAAEAAVVYCQEHFGELRARAEREEHATITMEEMART